jgi:hypothetical protein
VLGGPHTVVSMGWRDRTSGRRSKEESLEAVRRVAEEDVLHLGEELARFDRRTSGTVLDEDGRVELQTALDSYERASRLVEHLGTADEVSRVVDTLSAGRFALARVAARLAGEPLPQRPTPCFFDPRHGPATAEVLWTRPGRGSRLVPACRQDAARHAAGDEPEVRYLKIDGRRIPIWEAGSLLEPYTRGYFPTTVTEGRRDARAQGAVWQIDASRPDRTPPI